MSHQSDLPPHVPSCVSTGAGVEVPDVTATPRTDEDRINCLVAIGINATEAAQLVELAKPAIKMQEELTAAKAEIAAANEKLTYVHKMGLRFGMMKTTDKPEPYLAHIWDKDSDHERMFREWSDSIGIKVERDQLRARVAELEADKARLLTLAAFLQSVVKSGEPWTATCQREYDAARAGKGAT